MTNPHAINLDELHAQAQRLSSLLELSLAALNEGHDAHFEAGVEVAAQLAKGLTAALAE